MCLTCGCKLPNEDHGRAGVHITYNDLMRASDAVGISPKKALKNMRKTIKAAQDNNESAQREMAWPSEASKAQ